MPAPGGPGTHTNSLSGSRCNATQRHSHLPGVGGPPGRSQAQSRSQLSQVWKYLPEAPGPPLSPHPEGQELQVTRRQRLAALRPCPLPSSHRPPGRASRPRHRTQRSPVQGRCPSSAGRPVVKRRKAEPARLWPPGTPGSPLAWHTWEGCQGWPRKPHGHPRCSGQGKKEQEGGAGAGGGADKPSPVCG